MNIFGYWNIEDIATNLMISSIIQTPNADKKFIDSYNNFADICKNTDKMYKLTSNIPFIPSNIRESNKACERFYNILGNKIDTEKDIWEGLDYKVAKQIGKDRLLYIKGNGNNQIYLCPPEAGHNSGVIHFLNKPSKSIVLNALKYGDVYIMDKIGAKEEHANFGLEDCIKRSVDAIDYINGKTRKRVNVAGFCQGGWEAFVASYLRQDKVASFASGGTPYNWHSSDLSDLTREVNPADPNHAEKVIKQLGRIQNLIKRNNGIMPGLWNLFGFIYFSKEQLLDKDIKQLWKDAQENNSDGLQRFIDFRSWFMKPQSMGGEYFLEIFDKLYTKNQLYNGELMVNNQIINTSEFKLPIYLLNGRDPKTKIQKDNITSHGQQMDLLDIIGTSPADIISDDVSAGHIGVFNASKSMLKWNAWFKTITNPDFKKDGFDINNYYNKQLNKSKPKTI